MPTPPNRSDRRPRTEPLLKVACPQCGNVSATLERFHERMIDVACGHCNARWTADVRMANSETIKAVQAILLMRGLEQNPVNSASHL